MTIKAMAPWFGADNMISERIAHELSCCSWVGIPCVGGASIIPRLAARSVLAADKHRHLINMAKVVRDPVMGPKLYRAVRRLPFHADVLAEAQQRCALRESPPEQTGLFTQSQSSISDSVAPDLQWAIDYFVCCWMGRGGNAGKDSEFGGGMSFRWDVGGGTSIGRWSGAVGGLLAWRKVLSSAEFIVSDIFDFVAEVAKRDAKRELEESQLPRCGLYVDPPWPTAGKVYKHKFTDDQQEKLAAELARLTNTRVVVRFGDHPLIRRIYAPSRWTVIEHTSRTQGNADLGELLIINGPPIPTAQKAA